MDALVFYIAGITSVVAAGLVVTRRNPVYSAIYLVLLFTMISLQFLILRAPFLAVVQVLIYAGAIMVLFLFVIMLLNLTPEELQESISRSRKYLAGGLSFVLFLVLVAAIRKSPTVASAPNLVEPIPATEGTLALGQAGEIAAIGESLFTTHALAFELASVLILVAIIGAIYLTKRRRPTDADGTSIPTGLEAQEVLPETPEDVAVPGAEEARS
jgi:NADH-quinone oxidoreductase subunit J